MVFEQQIGRCAQTLQRKTKEYTGDNPDRLSAFKVAAAMQGCSPERALAGMMAKHIVSIYDMCYSDREHFDMDTWNEKITDTLNYLFLLKAIVEEGDNWGMPSIVREFLETATFQTKYLYFVATYGTTPGAIGAMANKTIRGHKIDAYYSVQMVDTWTPIFDLSTPEKVAKYTKNTEAQIDAIICNVKERHMNRRMLPCTPSFITKWIAEPIYNKKVRCTTHFCVEDSCIGCGLCAQKCPAQAIEMRNKKPVWVEDKCIMCLGCLHRCPKFAIQYGKNTKKHGQYTNPNVKR